MFTQNEINRLPPIFQSVYNGDIDAVSEYINQGGDLNVITLGGGKPKDLLQTAVEANNPEAVHLLLEADCVSHYGNDYVMNWAVGLGYLDLINCLLEKGCDPRIDGNFAIRIAAANGHLAVVNRLLEVGCDPQSYDDLAICLAAQNGHLDVVNRLLEAGCDPQAQGNFALQLAADYDHFNVVYALYDAATAQGKPIPLDITIYVQNALERRVMINNLPMIFSKIASVHGEHLQNSFAKIAKYDGRLCDKDMDTLEARTASAFNILAKKQ